jgi:signal peptidase II
MSEPALASAAPPVDPASPEPAETDSLHDGGGVSPSREGPLERPSYLFFGIVAAASLLADVVTKAWAEIALTDPGRTERSIEVIGDHLAFTLAYNRGGAWGLLQNASELVRRPFFVVVSLAAVVFIYSLYSRLTPDQRALKWGLPLVLGGALGNLADRIIRSSVVDFIDYRAGWIGTMNDAIARVFSSWHVTEHWPTFNVADIWICIGVGLMAIDMFTSRRPPVRHTPESRVSEPSAAVPRPSEP